MIKAPIQFALTEHPNDQDRRPVSSFSDNSLMQSFTPKHSAL